jgi:hypothetical protein
MAPDNASTSRWLSLSSRLRTTSCVCKSTTQKWNHPCASLPRAFAGEPGDLRRPQAC